MSPLLTICNLLLMVLSASFTVACTLNAWKVAFALLFAIILAGLLTRKIYKITKN